MNGKKGTKSNFWRSLPRPLFVLAPLADVTDAAFRELIAKYGKPDVMWTEFVSADGLAHPDAREKLLRDLSYTDTEHPIVAQLFGARPENMKAAAELCRELGFDGIDINMGCPDRSVEKQGAGAALIKDPARAREIIRAAQEGAGDLPVSVKTRTGYNRDEMDEWIPALLETGIAALTIHARTRKEMSKVPARWEDVARAVAIRNKMGADTLVIGNGDAVDLADARAKAAVSGADGIMLGRAIFGNPYLFNKDTRMEDLPLPERLRIMVEHTKLFEKRCEHKNFAVMKKHYSAYVRGFDGAKELRMELMETQDAAGVEAVVKNFLRDRVKTDIADMAKENQ